MNSEKSITIGKKKWTELQRNGEKRSTNKDEDDEKG